MAMKKGLKNELKRDLLKCLIEDPTRSVNEIAEKLNTSRQMIWRKKKELENDKVIWGYTTVIDENKVDRELYLAHFKLRPLSKKLIDLIIERMRSRKPEEEEGVSITEIFYAGANFDCFIKFSAPNTKTARKYYEGLRITYGDYFLENPELYQIAFVVTKMGKLNPELQKFYDFLP